MPGVLQTDDSAASTRAADATVIAPSRSERWLGALARYPAFRRLWYGMLAASVGQWMQQVALGWIALILTDAPAFVGIVTFAGGVPFILVGPPAGNLIDRIDRRRLLLVCQAVSAAVAFVVAADIFLGLVEPWHLVLAAFANGCLQSLMTPTQQSLVPILVERRDLTNAIGLMSAGQNLTRVAGPSVAGIMIAWWDVGPAFLAQGIMLLVAFLIIMTLVLPERRANPNASRNMFDGLRLIFATPEIRALFLLVAISTFFVYPYLSFINVIARDLLKIGASGLGLLMASSGAGAVVGALIVATRGQVTGVGRLLIGIGVIYGFLIVGIALSPIPLVTMVLMFIAGVIGSTAFSLNTAMVQHRIADEVRGRVMSAYFLTWGLMPLGALPMGALAERFGVQVALIAGAVAASVLVAVLGLTTPQFKRM